MTNVITYIGVDIAKLKFDICVYNGNFSSCVYESYTNDIDGFINFFSLLESVNNISDIRIGIEATSTYMINLQKFLDDHKVKYILINPKRIHHYIKYMNYESKTDKMDSYYIADYISKLEEKSFISSYSKNKYLYKTYSSYINMIIKTETHLKGIKDSIANDDFVSYSLKLEMFELEKMLKNSNKKITKELIETMKISMPEYDFIKNDIIGVGDKTLLAVLPLIYDVSEIYTIKQLQSFIGLNVVYKDSGSSVKGKQKISKSGNSEARKMLFNASVTSIRPIGGNPILRDKYKRLIDSGKPAKVALVAVSAHIFRAIVSRLNHYKQLNKK